MGNPNFWFFEFLLLPLILEFPRTDFVIKTISFLALGFLFSHLAMGHPQVHDVLPNSWNVLVYGYLPQKKNVEVRDILLSFGSYAER